jgi:hypothetical protein
MSIVAESRPNSNTNPPLVTVYDGRKCIGHILRRGQCGFEAFDHTDFSLGTFPTEREAANAIIVGVPT